MDIQTAANTLSQSECFLSGQVCSSLTRIVVPRSRHDELLEALAGTFSQVRVGDPFDAQTRKVAGQLRSGTVGHHAFRTDFSVSSGGFKQSGIGRSSARRALIPAAIPVPLTARPPALAPCATSAPLPA